MAELEVPGGKRTIEEVKELLCSDSAGEKVMDVIVKSLVVGASLAELSNVWNVCYHELYLWINDDEGRSRRYRDAVKAKQEYLSDSVLDQLKRVALSDLRELYDRGFQLKDIKDLPDDVAATLSQIDENASGTIKVKTHDKMKAIELMGKNLGLFIEQRHVTGKVSIEDMVADSFDAVDVEPSDDAVFTEEDTEVGSEDSDSESGSNENEFDESSKDDSDTEGDLTEDQKGASVE